MIISGIKEINKGAWSLSQLAAQELINELQRAMEEAKDHQISFDALIHYEVINSADDDTEPEKHFDTLSFSVGYK